MPTKTVQPRDPGPVRLFHPPSRPACGGSRVWLPPDPEGWVVEPKYNGHRVILDSEHGVLHNRHLKPYSHVLPSQPHLAKQCRRKYIKFLDMEAMGPRAYAHRPMGILFDVYGVASTTLERRSVLLGLGYPVHDPFRDAVLRSGQGQEDWDRSAYHYVVPQYPAKCADALFHALMLLPGDAYEGIVLKQIDNQYRNNRWVKFRFDQYNNER